MTDKDAAERAAKVAWVKAFRGDKLVVRPANGCTGMNLSPVAVTPTGEPLEMWEILLPEEESGDIVPKCDTRTIRAVTDAELSFGDEFYEAIFGQWRGEVPE